MLMKHFKLKKFQCTLKTKIILPCLSMLCDEFNSKTKKKPIQKDKEFDTARYFDFEINLEK